MPTENVIAILTLIIFAGGTIFVSNAITRKNTPVPTRKRLVTTVSSGDREATAPVAYIQNWGEKKHRPNKGRGRKGLRTKQSRMFSKRIVPAHRRS